MKADLEVLPPIVDRCILDGSWRGDVCCSENEYIPDAHRGSNLRDSLFICDISYIDRTSTSKQFLCLFQGGLCASNQDNIACSSAGERYGGCSADATSLQFMVSVSKSSFVKDLFVQGSLTAPVTIMVLPATLSSLREEEIDG